ncbi:MAG: RNA 2',3'-cyclic phosphodiesterase [Acidimicrobiia bacterium]|jgi:2'-5' RNA ligase
MASVGRAFVAVFPPESVVDALDARLASAPASAGPSAAELRWSPRADWHVTLRFAGRVADVERLVEGVGVAVAAAPPVAGLQLTGAGAFPEPGHGSVLWVGVEESPALASLAATVERACVEAGLAPDDRVFNPHVTVARTGRACDLRLLVDAIGPDLVGDPWTATEVRLMASATRPTGAVYTELARFPLA